MRDGKKAFRRGARKRGGAPIGIAQLVAKVYPSKSREDLQAAYAFHWWAKAVPSRVLQNARPVRLVRGVLTVHTRTSAWANELDLLREDLMRAIRRNAPNAGVTSIRVRVGRLPDVPLPLAPTKPREVVVPLEVLPEALARALSRIADDDLRTAIAGAAATSLGERRKDRD